MDKFKLFCVEEALDRVAGRNAPVRLEELRLLWDDDEAAIHIMTAPLDAYRIGEVENPYLSEFPDAVPTLTRLVPIMPLWEPVLADLRAEQLRMLPGHYKLRPSIIDSLSRGTSYWQRCRNNYVKEREAHIGPPYVPPIHLERDPGTLVVSYCQHCNRPFIAPTRFYRYCCDSCQREATQPAQRERQAVRVEIRSVQGAAARACAYCHKPFTPQRADARFCSNRCRVAAHRAARLSR